MSRKRSFNIEDILEEDQNLLFSKYVTRIEDEEETNDKFKIRKYRAKYVFQKIEKIDDPFETLRNLFENTIKDVLEKAREDNFEPQKMGFEISSVNLEPDIRIPFNVINENTVPAIFNRFRLIEQSKSKEQSLLGEPFTIQITLLNQNALPTTIETSGRGKKNGHVRHLIDESKLIEINNNDSYCLFYALEIMRVYTKEYIGEKRMTKQTFNNFRKNIMEQRILVIRLLSATRIEKNLNRYDAQIYCPIIQQYWDEQWPNTFRIFIFSEYGTYRPAYSSPDTSYKYPIILYHKDDHFSGVRTMCRFFNTCPYYCFSCMAPYHIPANHKFSCKRRCINCTRVGPEFPCTIAEEEDRHCYDCNKNFLNKNCFEWHKEKKICETLKKCLKCGIIYNKKDLERQRIKKHFCSHRFCKECLTYHEGLCYIKPLVLEPSKPYRLAFFDFECKQNKQVITSSGKLNLCTSPTS
jgi:hypothetical protein